MAPPAAGPPRRRRGGCGGGLGGFAPRGAAAAALLGLGLLAPSARAVRDEGAEQPRLAAGGGGGRDGGRGGDRLSCGGVGSSVAGPVGVGAQGVVFRAELDDGRSAVVKVSPSYPGSMEGIEREVSIEQALEHVPHTLKYVAHCGGARATEGMVSAAKAKYPQKTWVDGELDMLLLSPFVAGAQECDKVIGGPGCAFATEASVRSALRQTFETLWAILAAGVTNHDQAPQNILFSPDGTPTFIDMGYALFISEVHPMLTVEFVRGIFNLVPRSAETVQWVEKHLIRTRPPFEGQQLQDGRGLAAVVDETWAAWKEEASQAAAAAAAAA